MLSTGLGSQTAGWLVENGPRELELLFRAIVYHPSAPILLTDDKGNSRDASFGVGRILGIPREQIIGHSIDEFALPAFKPKVSQLFAALPEKGELEGSLGLLGSNGTAKHVAFAAKANVLPVRHLLVLHEKAVAEAPADSEAAQADAPPPWVKDFALFLLDVDGLIVAWYAGAERIYGYPAEKVIGKHVSCVYSPDAAARGEVEDKLKRAVVEGHLGSEGWHVKSDGERFWANVIIMALRRDDGTLQGFASIVRDFSGRHEQDEKIRRNRARTRLSPLQSTIAGVVSGEFDRIPEANDTFLELVGYSREDLKSGLLQWPELTPPEFAPLDELAHEEGLRFGACTPYEKELVCKDGRRVPVLVATAVLKLSPFRWISFVQDLRERDRRESVEEEITAPTQDFGEIVGTSTALRRVQSQVEVVAPTDANVLILGETGTGKELVARAIHRISPRRNLPFVTLNCAAIPTGLLESELFGYERGAFTGALSQKIGRFEMAHRGTLFLDEVGDIPLDLQPKLLRALQEKSFERLGGTKTIPIDVRLVAATNRNLTQMMGDKLFRSDLYYRLRVFPISTPPLRDHPEDIPTLARHFTVKYAEKMGRQIDKIPSETMNLLVSYQWPGNVRELENFIERSVILSSGSSLRAPLAELQLDQAPFAGNVTLEQVEREHIIRVFRESGGVVTTTATRLGLHRTTLNAIMRKLGISRKDL
ncbi:sigma 54-interacting transcriptional regulator [Paludibaculum fermentans]|uniref:sigma 54-interacting transcriptional regulator n=1 Tax=Paludibaculum fermentans TaxID=1473598 RepID=UPI001E37512E|nr:sigma 54-interacting transcriptional regulator [Paludibaculum fermentans]